MQTTEVVVSEVNRLHCDVVLEALAVGLSQASESFDVQPQLLVQAFNVRSANAVWIR